MQITFSFWFSLNSSYKHEFHLLLELTLPEPLTLNLNEEVRMQEEWHCNKRKCTFVIPAQNLLLLDLDIGLPLHIRSPLHHHCAINCHCPQAVHCCHHHCIAVAPSITIVAIALSLCHPLLFLLLRCHPAFHCCHSCAIHRHRYGHSAIHCCHRHCIAVAPCIILSVMLSVLCPTVVQLKCSS